MKFLVPLSAVVMHAVNRVNATKAALRSDQNWFVKLQSETDKKALRVITITFLVVSHNSIFRVIPRFLGIMTATTETC